MARPLTVLIAGGSGMIGTALSRFLSEEGHRVHILTRSTDLVDNSQNAHLWNPELGQCDLDALAQEIGTPVDVIINLAGASISKMPWTKSYQRLILQSRIDATRTLVDAINSAKNQPQVLVNGSAVGFYGNRHNEALDEGSRAGEGFLADVVQQWENEASLVNGKVRVVYARTGIVLGKGGALAPLRLLTKFFAAGPLAGGKAWWPWISLRDEVRALSFLMTASISGPVNLVGPTSHTSADISRALAKKLHRPFWLPAPGFAIKLVLGTAGEDVLLSSQKVSPAVLLTSGFIFVDEDIDTALDSALD